jgi:hypothetical protein
MAESRPPDECANCGATIPRQARACPQCGADERTGWREPSTYDGLDLPASAYDDGVPKPLRRGLAWYWIVAIVAAIIVSLFFSLGGR